MVRSKSQLVFFSILIGFACLLIYDLGFRSNNIDNESVPVLEFGKSDLSTHNFNEIPVLHVKGNVEFYYNQLLTPANINDSSQAKLSGYISLYDIWNKFEVDNKPIGSFGYGTYHFTMQNVPPDEFYAFKIAEFNSAYILWVNGEKVIECGRVADNKKGYVPSWEHFEHYLKTDSTNLDILIQVANFHHRKGGTEGMLLFGKGNDILKQKTEQLTISFFVLGILFIMAIYHFVLYLYRRNDKSILYFGVFNALIMLRIMLTSDKVFVTILPFIPWVVYIRFEYLSMMLVAPVFLFFLHNFYPDKVSKKVTKVILYITLAFSSIVIFTPVGIFSYTVIPFQIVLAFVSCYSIISLFRAYFSKKEHSSILLMGTLIFLLLVINDVLHFNRVVVTSYTMPLGLIAVVLSQAFVLARKTSRAFSYSEKLSAELEDYNLQLEEKIDIRTREIEEQKEILVEKSELLQESNNKLVELDLFKETVINMIVHDLKNQLNIIMALSENNVVRLAGRQMLYMVYNILDVNKYENAELVPDFRKNYYLETIQNTIKQFDILFRQKEIELVSEISSDFYFAYDSELVERVLANLLSNAIKYSYRNNKITVRVEFVDLMVKTSITNFGEPIVIDGSYSIFDKYEQNNRINNNYGASYGLGLAFCKMACEAHGGEIGYSSDNENGTTFWFTVDFNNGVIIELKEDAIIKEVQTNFNIHIITAFDKDYLKAFAIEMSSYNLINSKDILDIIRSVNVDFSVGVSYWTRQVKASVMNYDSKQYNVLINLIVE